MKRMNVIELNKLKNIQNDIQISIYLPMVPGPEGTAKNVSVLHSATAFIKKTLKDTDIPRKHQVAIANYIRNIDVALLHPMPGKSLAIFITNTNEVLAYKVPFEVETIIYYMAPHMQLEPLIQHYEEQKHYWVLSLSQKGCELFKGFGDSLKKVNINELTIDLKTALGLDEVNEHSTQSHTVSSGGGANEGFHGHGGFKDLHKKYLKDYMRFIDKNIKKYASNESEPLYLMGVAQTQQIFRSISSKKKVFVTSIGGNADGPIGVNKVKELVTAHLPRYTRVQATF